MNCLTYASSATTVLREAVRVLRLGGVVTGVTLSKHEHDRAVAAYGHVNRGFHAKRLGRMLREADLSLERCVVTSREQRPPHHEVITFHARKEPAS